MKTLQELYQLWDRLGNVPVSKKDKIEVKFLDFEKGTPREDLWHWFESQNSEFVVGEVLSGRRRSNELQSTERPCG